MNNTNTHRQKFTTEYGTISIGLNVNDLQSGYAQQYKLNSPYLVGFEKFNCATKQVQINLYGPGFSKKHTEEFSLLNEREMHQHSFFELMYVASGSVIQQIEGKEYVYTEGQCCLLNHHVRHMEFSTTDSTIYFLDLSDHFFLDTIHADIMFDDRGYVILQKNTIYDFMQTEYKKKITQKQYWNFNPIVSSEFLHFSLLDMFSTLIEETTARKPGFVLIIQGIITRILSTIIDKNLYEYQKYILDGDKEELLFLKVQDILLDNNGRISREHLSKKTNYSANHLNRIVKKYTGMSLVEYGRIFTLAEAAKLLKETDMKISEIMNYLHFSNRTYFYRLFKEQFGVTPIEYRHLKSS